MNNLLNIEGLHAGYGKHEVLHDVSFSTKKGELCALLGSNGCGKSTLLRSVCQLIPSRGNCILNNKSIIEMSPRERAQQIGYLAQQKATPLALEAIEIVLMGYNPALSLLQKPSSAQIKSAYELLKIMQAEQYANKDFSALSEGQRQLVLFARTLVQRPSLLILDEPDSALDYANRHKILRYLKNYALGNESGILLCSHDINLSLRYADRLLFLKNGSIHADISPSKTDAIALSRALSDIYGPVNVIMHNGYYLMTEGEPQ